ncbi:hypothetical protein WDH52_23650 [Streptomyces sp. TRM70308]|uniref:hypothetical protein n=1 Tax=Streptomyces sp. TRM70308 TaxID=3131932 RepID=UPI003D00F5D8
MKEARVSPSDIEASPIAMCLATELAECSISSTIEIYQAAVEIALSFSTGSAVSETERHDHAVEHYAAARLAEVMNASSGVLGSQDLLFPQAIIGARSQTVLRPPRLSKYGDQRGKPVGALWTSSFLASERPTWTAMTETGYVPVEETLEYVELIARKDDVQVFAIRSSADFASLCDEFACVSPQGDLTIDWIRVADSYHAVHLTFAGLILAQANPVRTRAGTMTLQGWDSESTAWLRLPASARLGKRRVVVKS